MVTMSGQATSHNSYMGGNAFEALVGAIYLDRGYSACMKFMEKRILKQLINIDKMAYKEVNFKSKLLEWSQKNRVKLEFSQLEQSVDEHNSPIFVYQVLIEGVEGGSGKGYSKKESQQLASKETLQRLRREPQFIDAVFAAKGDRTKMEEEPVMSVPDPEKEQEDFIIETKREEETKSKKQAVSNETVIQSDAAQYQALHDEFTLDDISAKPREKTREEIIAEAEAAAFAEA
jgi:ribonuclease-3